ncbi:GLUG domain protein [Chloroherpeton thalassium ATCC 35110]|uniref:GLUG domain protein n=1 Tax=Chloroherpeton thalassium (strain ATCC 35110 / GB-78) TaxID=517418 RepID=B3QS53_CHLT3|nr:T9SS type A sorting domain-containing protein [Chloroherpeton thalassium]ACF13998.1 GLUG domain protein [Chloroherpeton thalassium ATCC 35110]
MNLLKRLFLLTLAVLFFCKNLSFAQTAVAPDIGDGTEGNPYQIATWQNLYWLSIHSDQWGKHYKQVANIDIGGIGSIGGSGWSPIGNSGVTAFTGVYDGNGKTVYGLTIDRPVTDYVGLFGYLRGVDAVIKNLRVKNASVSGKDDVGVLVGHNLSGTIENCCALGEANGSQSVGGLVGRNEANGKIRCCYASGSVSGVGAYIGGLVGENVHSTIENCYAISGVSGDTYIGGLVGNNYEALVTHCYAYGGVTFSNAYGGYLVGQMYNASIVSSVCRKSEKVPPVGLGAGGLGVTDEEMRLPATYLSLGWDFAGESDNGDEDYWNHDGERSLGCPFLNWEANGKNDDDDAEISGGSSDEFDFSNAGAWVAFVESNSDDVILNILQTDATPNIEGSLPEGISTLSPLYWTGNVVLGEINGKYNIKLDLTGITGIENCGTLHVLKRENNTQPWKDVETDLGATLDRSDCPNSITVEGLTSFSDFVIAGGADNPLPVELSGFSGASTNDGVRLNWKTAAETDNAGFVLYRNDAEIASYQNTDALKGAGTTSGETAYSFVDSDVYLGESYTYKIASVDISGTAYEYETTVSVKITESMESEAETKAYEYALEQNYPNPFNPSTLIRFSLKQAGNTTLRVFDMLGREILSKQFTGKAGWNAYQFNASGLSSGMYYYQISSGSFVETKKMMLLK